MRLSFIVMVAVLAFAGAAGAQNLRHVYRTAPSLVGLSSLAEDGRYQNAADVILEQAIRNLPLHPAASSAYTFRWDDEHGTLERVDAAVAPWLLTERGQTLGKGLLNIGVTFGYYDVDSFDGHDLGHDPFPVSVCCGSKIRYQAPTDLLYTVGTFNFTYGLLDDLDLNIAIPIVTLDMGLDVTRQDTPSAPIRRAMLDQNSANLSDMLVRAKYRLFETGGALGTTAGAVGVRVRIPQRQSARGSRHRLRRDRSVLRAVDQPRGRLARFGLGRRGGCRHRQPCAGAPRTTPGRSTPMRHAVRTGGRAWRSCSACSDGASSPASATRRRSRGRT